MKIAHLIRLFLTAVLLLLMGLGFRRSMDALKKMYQSDKFHEANINRIKGLESTIADLFKPTPLSE